jgi:hypothetical protein
MLFFTFFIDTWDIVMPVLIVVAFIGICTFIGLAIREGRKQVRQNQESDQDVGSNDDMEESDDGWTPPEPEAFPARVVDMRAVVGNVGGHKRPKTGTSFLVTFLTDDGARMEYPVPEELYVTLNIDQTGTLVILNNGFFDFGDGEDMEETPDAEGV